MKKKILSLFLTFAMLAGLSVVPLTAANAATGADIKLGQYLQLGTYYGNPILWRCVGFEKIIGNDANGNPITDATDTKTVYEKGYLPLILCDKIISFKAFDAEVTANQSTGSHSRGVRSIFDSNSNYWGDSTLRSWLNSDASAGNVQWLCGNPPTADKLFFVSVGYDQEAGFLSNFTQLEKSPIKTVTQKSILSTYDKDLRTMGTEEFKKRDNSLPDTIDNWVQNYSTAYAEYVTDTMFLLDIKQLQNVYKNSNILGDEYYVGKPTVECFTEIGLSPSYDNGCGMAAGEDGNYWLRTPNYTDSPTMYLVNYESIGITDGYHGVTGVRPAFFLNPTAAILYGAGSENNPYSMTAPVSTSTPTTAPAVTPTTTPPATQTVAPTVTPTVAPTAAPTIAPTAAPTIAPTAAPTAVPTAAPIVTQSPAPISNYPYVINDLSLKSTDGKTLTAFPLNTGFIVNTQFQKVQQKNDTDLIFAAVYDKKGALLSLDYVQANFAENYTYDIGFYIQPQTEEIGSVKTFIWGSFGDMTPLAQSKELTNK